MRKFKLLTLLAAAMMTANMWAGTAIGTTGLEWEYADGTLTISYTGSGTTAMEDYISITKQPWKSNRTDITAIVIGNGVTTIGRNNFASCTNLTTVTVGENVSSLGITAFKDCSNLTSVTFSAATPATLGTNVFQNTSASLKLYVPDANAQAYSNAWLAYEGKIYCATSTELAPAPHETGDCGASLSWDYTDHVLTITGTGDMTDYTGTDVPWYNYMKYITSVSFPNGMTSIGAYALDGATALTAISFPSSLKSIGYKAFFNCKNASLTSITFPASIDSIAVDAFYGCDNVTDIYMSSDPASLKWNDGGCDDFIKSPKKTTRCHVSAEQFAGYVAKNTGSTSTSGGTDIDVTFVIPDFTSGSCTLTFGSQGTGCETSMTITGSGDMADYGSAAAQPWADYTSDITKIIINNGVTHIGDYAFSGCSNLAYIQTIPATPPTLGTDAFYGHPANVEISKYPCMSYASYVSDWDVFAETCFTEDCVAPDNTCGNGLVWDVTSNVLTITKAYPGNGAMTDFTSGATRPAPWKSSASTLTSIVIGSGVTHIGNRAFYECNNASLTEIPIPEGVTSIGDYAFSSTNITDITLPSTLTSIGAATFGVTQLTEITIPANVTSIGNNAFSNCYSLTTVNMLPITAPTAGGSNIFNYSTKVSAINYPCGSSSYESTWSDYSALLHEECEEAAPSANMDSETGAYFSTYYNGTHKMALQNDGTEAYIAKISGSDLMLYLLADGDDIIPADEAVILKKSTSGAFSLRESTGSPASLPETNDLRGTDVAMSAPANCYVLSGNDGVGFYQWTAGKTIPAHKAYLIYPKMGSTLPTRMRFVIGNKAPTSVGEVEGDDVQTTKVIENGQFFIIKNGVRYNAQGQIVK